MRYELVTTVWPELIRQRILCIDLHTTDIPQEVWNQMIDLQDKGVRDALISLGWTPPTDPVNQDMVIFVRELGKLDP